MREERLKNLENKRIVMRYFQKNGNNGSIEMNSYSARLQASIYLNVHKTVSQIATKKLQEFL